MNNNTAQNGQSTKAQNNLKERRKKAANAAQARRAKTNLQTANADFVVSNKKKCES